MAELRPVRLEPLFVPRIWGSRNLAPFFPEKKSLSEPIGEVWLTGNECRFADGPFAGEKLADVWPRMTEDWAGKRVRRDKPFPLLVKFLFPQDKLSVQVHPDDDYAMCHEAAAGGVGKTEMWYVISARPGAEVRVGLKSEVTEGSFRRAIADGAAEELLERIPVTADDAIFVPAGTAHTIGPGMVLCEIQQNSDITYRVYDFGRLDAHGKPRELHIEKALDVLRFGKQESGKVTPVSVRRGPLTETVLLMCRHFTAAHWIFEKPVERIFSLIKHFYLCIFLQGAGHICWDGGEAAYCPAQVWFIPAELGKVRFAPDTPTSLVGAAPATWAEPTELPR